ncbi:uncharacterized protein LOC128456195 isoform X2 [Pleuronectes platessa]|uniref:uncharacterized protein LOC128456195 isoform X2 n=1 Tax=Pleuronectes platessa TaxID=8262 RepID=UPI00232A5212|nr:uncharacterized protein LOC128456195 isoform X2 [Pleuronectes platessa]
MIFNIFIIFISTVYLSCHQSIGSPSQWSDFNVTQPEHQTVNQDGVASISCEHDAPVSSILDVRLNRVSQGQTSMLCQKGEKNCKDIFMYPQYPNKCLFIILNLRPEDMDATYQCEFTVKKDGIEKTKTGTPTRLRPEGDCIPPPPPPPSPPPPPPPRPQPHDLTWMLIGLMALFLLYGCVITCVFIRLRVTNQNHRLDHENSTYVEMRKAPLRAK